LKLRDFPSVEQVRVVVAAMPVETVIDRRNRALIAFAILTGMRDRAIVSLSLRQVDLSKSPPLVRQEPDRVDTKFSKSIITYFFPLGSDLQDIIIRWIEELRTEHLFGPNDPVFPKTRVSLDDDKSFRAAGIEAVHWRDASPVRAIFHHAFAKAGLPYFSPHSLRHTRASYAIGLPHAQADEGVESKSRPRKHPHDPDVIWDHRSPSTRRGNCSDLAGAGSPRRRPSRKNPRPCGLREWNTRASDPSSCSPRSMPLDKAINSGRPRRALFDMFRKPLAKAAAETSKFRASLLRELYVRKIFDFGTPNP
jgi:hypothetical protein